MQLFEMVKKFLIFAVLAIFHGCNSLSDNSKRDDRFYETIDDWDIQYVPIIPPFRAASTYPDQWLIGGSEELFHLTRSTRGDIPVLAFGVSKNYIYGTTRKGHTQQIAQWFLFNTNNLLYSEYSTETELTNTLRRYQLEKNPITLCGDYFKQLANGERCYWFPRKGEPYPKYPDFRPDSSIEIQVKGGENGIDFHLPKEIQKLESRIYYFRMKYEKKDNELFYVSFDSSSPVLIKDDQIIPAYAEGSSIDVTVYTPYPVGQAKGIDEKNRIVITKAIKLKD